MLVRTANREGPDQTGVYTVCPDIFGSQLVFEIFRSFTVYLVTLA